MRVTKETWDKIPTFREVASSIQFCWASELKHPFNIHWLPGIRKLRTWDTAVPETSLGPTLTNLRFWFGKLRNTAKWTSRCYQRARAEVLGTSQGAELMETTGKTFLRKWCVSWDLQDGRKLASLRGKTLRDGFFSRKSICKVEIQGREKARSRNE